MNNIDVANLELCKELYKLSGWTTDWEWYIDPEGRQSLTYVPGGTVDVYDDDTLYPAYDLGFLLRKLPAKVWKDDDQYMLEIEKWDTNEWAYRYINYGRGKGPYRGLIAHVTTSPEDAACKLAIELFRQGVLAKTPR